MRASSLASLQAALVDWRSNPPKGTAFLSVSPFRDDHSMLRKSLHDCVVHEAHTCREALEFLCKDRVAVIVCESGLPDGNWKDLLSEVASLLDPPCLVVTSRLADDRLWAEVLNLGGYDLLAKPFEADELERVVMGAWRHWENVRSHRPAHSAQYLAASA